MVCLEEEVSLLLCQQKGSHLPFVFAEKKDIKDPTPKGLIYLINAKVVPFNRKEFGFTVVTGQREYHICGNSSKEQSEWMEAISSCVYEATPQEVAAFEQRQQVLSSPSSFCLFVCC